MKLIYEFIHKLLTICGNISSCINKLLKHLCFAPQRELRVKLASSILHNCVQNCEVSLGQITTQSLYHGDDMLLVLHIRRLKEMITIYLQA
jgi:hypothetical protein